MSNHPISVLFVEDDQFIRNAVRQAMELDGIQITAFSNPVTALNSINAEFLGVVVSDIRMPDMDGLELHQKIRAIDSEIPVILITGHGDIAMAVQAIRDGVYDFIEKPFGMDTLLEAVHRAAEKRALGLENRQLRQELDLQTAPGQKIIGDSEHIQSLRSQIAKLAKTDADILLWGETGTGKDMVARILHESSARRDEPYVAINCGALPESISESELFGHVAGAFSGAKKRRVGKLEYASEGTVFLDEIENLNLNLQAKLLRVLQEQAVEPVGSNRQLPINIRVIASTKTDLKKASDAQKFREDLYYRLNIITLKLPALRERKEDIPLLFRHYAMIVAARYEIEIPEFKPERLQSLVLHDWPGNVRELKNYAERFVLLGGDVEEVDTYFERYNDEERSTNRQNLPAQVEWFEKNMIEQALAQSGGSIKAALEMLGVPRKTLYDKMKKYQIDKKQFKEN